MNMMFIQDCSVAIIPNIHNGRRRLIVHGSGSSTVNHMWLDSEGSWGTTTESITSGHHFTRVVSVAKYEHYLMGGSTSRHGKSTR